MAKRTAPPDPQKALAVLAVSVAPNAVTDPYREGNPARRVMGPVRAVSHWPALHGNRYTQDSALYDLFEEMLHKDGKIYAAADQRLDAVTNCRRQLIAAGSDLKDQEVRDFVEAALGGLGGGGFDGLIDAILQCLLMGLSVIELNWEAQGGRIVPTGYRHLHPSQFSFDTAGQMFDALSRSAQPLAPERYLVARYGSQFGNPYGDGLLAHVMYHYWFKKNAITFWLQAAERIGAPALLGKYPAGDAAALNQLTTVLADMKVNGYAAIPESWAIEVLRQANEAGAFGEGLHGLCDWLDDQISQALVGSTLTSSEGRRSGSLALGTIHDDIRREKTEGDARLVTQCINEQLIDRLVEWNFGPDTARPHWVIETTAPENMAEKAETYRKLTGMGVPISLKHIHEAFDLPIPAEGERTLRFDDTNLYQYHLQYGILTVNEVRATLGLPPVMTGDAPTNAGRAGMDLPLAPAGTGSPAEGVEDSLIEELEDITQELADRRERTIFGRIARLFSKKKA
jgi:phage gp29-like protein